VIDARLTVRVNVRGSNRILLQASASFTFNDGFGVDCVAAQGHNRLVAGRLFERIQHPHVETGEVPHVARDDGQIMHERPASSFITPVPSGSAVPAGIVATR